ncbi:MAG TPA: zf-HC2 domain-containing protein [Vicinamibacterales bacterium]|nr:zf-HC2 domain-containing protein [Vicinamibacterales bacterium]
MNCRDATDFLTDYLAGDLPPGVAADFEAHLEECANCVALLDQFKACIAATRLAYTGPCAPADCDIPEELVRAIMRVLARVC